MKCLICSQEIKSGEYVFCGSQMICDGHGFMDFCYSLTVNELVGAIHLACLKSPAAAAKTPNTVVPEPVEEESAVQRSDALTIFD